jgi:hypothetical protein
MKFAWFMLGFVLAFFAISLSGCSNSCELPSNTPRSGDLSNLNRYEDKENGVICYRAAFDSLSCVKVK